MIGGERTECVGSNLGFEKPIEQRARNLMCYRIGEGVITAHAECERADCGAGIVLLFGIEKAPRKCDWAFCVVI